MSSGNSLIKGMIEDGLDVWIQDPTTPPFHYYLMNEQKTDITLTEIVPVDVNIINVSAGHGFTTSSYMVIYENNKYLQAKVTAVNTNAITIKTLTANTFSLDAIVIRGSIEMNIDASVTPVTFKWFPRSANIPLHIQYGIIKMINQTEPDDSKFGDIAAIINGLIVRRENGIITNYGTYSNNSDFAEFGADVKYSDKAGGGAFSTTIIFEMKKIFGTVIEMNPSLPDMFYSIAKDNFSGLLRFRFSILGHYTQGEV